MNFIRVQVPTGIVKAASSGAVSNRALAELLRLMPRADDRLVASALVLTQEGCEPIDLQRVLVDAGLITLRPSVEGPQIAMYQPRLKFVELAVPMGASPQDRLAMALDAAQGGDAGPLGEALTPFRQDPGLTPRRFPLSQDPDHLWAKAEKYRLKVEAIRRKLERTEALAASYLARATQISDAVSPRQQHESPCHGGTGGAAPQQSETGGVTAEQCVDEKPEEPAPVAGEILAAAMKGAVRARTPRVGSRATLIQAFHDHLRTGKVIPADAPLEEVARIALGAHAAITAMFHIRQIDVGPRAMAYVCAAGAWLEEVVTEPLVSGPDFVVRHDLQVAAQGNARQLLLDLTLWAHTNMCFTRRLEVHHLFELGDEADLEFRVVQALRMAMNPAPHHGEGWKDRPRTPADVVVEYVRMARLDGIAPWPSQVLRSPLSQSSSRPSQDSGQPRPLPAPDANGQIPLPQVGRPRASSITPSQSLSKPPIPAEDLEAKAAAEQSAKEKRIADLLDLRTRLFAEGNALDWLARGMVGADAWHVIDVELRKLREMRPVMVTPRDTPSEFGRDVLNVDNQLAALGYDVVALESPVERIRQAFKGKVIQPSVMLMLEQPRIDMDRSLNGTWWDQYEHPSRLAARSPVRRRPPTIKLHPEVPTGVVSASRVTGGEH